MSEVLLGREALREVVRRPLKELAGVEKVYRRVVASSKGHGFIDRLTSRLRTRSGLTGRRSRRRRSTSPATTT
jgi:hypothetical protein